MLAIGRALLGNPRLLIMDEPTEGLAPDHRRPGRRDAGPHRRGRTTCRSSSSSRTSASPRPSPSMSRSWSTAASTGSCRRRELAADRDLQQRLLGVGRHDDERDGDAGGSSPRPRRGSPKSSRWCAAAAGVRPAGERPAIVGSPLVADRCPTAGRCRSRSTRRRAAPRAILAAQRRRRPTARTRRRADVFEMPLAERHGRTALVVGTFDTKGRELKFIRDALARSRHPHPHRRSLDLGQAVERRRDRRRRWRARIRAAPARSSPATAARRSRRWPTAFARWIVAPARHRRRHLGRRLGRHLARHRRHAHGAGRRPEDHDLDRRLRRCRPLCRRRATS